MHEYKNSLFSIQRPLMFINFEDLHSTWYLLLISCFPHISVWAYAYWFFSHNSNRYHKYKNVSNLLIFWSTYTWKNSSDHLIHQQQFHCILNYQLWDHWHCDHLKMYCCWRLLHPNCSYLSNSLKMKYIICGADAYRYHCHFMPSISLWNVWKRKKAIC